MKNKKMILVSALLVLGVFLGSTAYAVPVEWIMQDWRAWGRLYDENGNPAPDNLNPYDDSPTIALPHLDVAPGYKPGVYTGGDGTEDAFGVARVERINDMATSNAIWQESANRELNIFFWGADDVQLSFFGSTAELLTTGFKAEVWLDKTPDFDFTQGPEGRNNPADETHYETVTDGDGELVLVLEGHNLIDALTGGIYQVKENGDASTGAFTGSVFLDVVGGTWMELYDTNTQDPGNSATQGLADMVMSFSTLPNNAHGWSISGNPTGQADALVPEPATLALMGIGLIGLAAAGRKKLFK